MKRNYLWEGPTQQGIHGHHCNCGCFCKGSDIAKLKGICDTCQHVIADGGCIAESVLPYLEYWLMCITMHDCWQHVWNKAWARVMPCVIMHRTCQWIATTAYISEDHNTNGQARWFAWPSHWPALKDISSLVFVYVLSASFDTSQVQHQSGDTLTAWA